MASVRLALTWTSGQGGQRFIYRWGRKNASSSNFFTRLCLSIDFDMPRPHDNLSLKIFWPYFRTFAYIYTYIYTYVYVYRCKRRRAASLPQRFLGWTKLDFSGVSGVGGGGQGIHIHIYIYVCICIQMYINICTIYVLKYICMLICIYIFINIYAHVCTYVYIY